MKFTRVLSHGKCPVEQQVTWKKVDAQVKDMRTGAAIFEQADVEVPEQWSDHAASILSQKYFRKAGVPARAQYHQPHPHDPLMPKWLHPSLPADGCATGGEISARQVFHRLSGAWTYHGWLSGIFDQTGGTVLGSTLEADENARVFYDEIYLCLAHQIAAPNSPQWFNTGLWWAYGIEGNDSGMWVCDDGTPRRINTSYVRPQPHACFLTSVKDDLVNPGGIMDAWVREARIFKHGSGSGMNVSALRAKGELLAGGGKSSGVMSWLRIGDSAAGAIQSGGTTRRAAVMRIMDVDHPEVEEFIDWKVREESKAAAMHVGSRMLRECEEDLPEHFVPQQVRDRLENGFDQEVFGIGWEGEANRTIDGQNSNNSVRVTDDFMRSLTLSGTGKSVWNLKARTNGAAIKAVYTDELWDKICRAAWASADPGLLFHDTINAWNTTAADGVIRTTNPCGEFHHLDGSACNLASLRLTAFLRDDSSVDLALLQHVCRLFTVVLDVSVSMASFPAEEFALGAWRYRTLGLGYADLGALLMRTALPYDSDKGRALAAALTSLMTGVAYKTSAEMAAEVGSFPQWEPNAGSMRRVLRNHARAARLTRELIVGAEQDEYEGLDYLPAPVACNEVPKELIRAIQHVWVDVCGAESFRNAQVTLLAPTGTISFVMDCDTTGVESDLGLVKYKNLAGGGSMKIVNQSVARSLAVQGFDGATIAEIVRYVEEHGTVEDCPAIPVEFRPRAYAVFECSNPAPGFTRCLRWEAHVEMLAAVQPHLSGAASKTINLPNSATVEDVSAAYLMAWKLGVKAVALYRDGCKLSQPLQTAPIEQAFSVGAASIAVRPLEAFQPSSRSATVLARETKEYLPWRRERGYTQKAKIGDQTLFWRVSEYPDGRPGEIFIELAHEGSTMRAIANSVAIAMSVALQHGTPIAELVDKFLYVKFEPAGYVEGYPHVKFATSIFDLIAKDLAITYLGRDDLKTEQPYAAVDDPEKVVALDRRALAAVGGSLTGDPCPACGGLLRRTGTCRTCINCAWNEGCG